MFWTIPDHAQTGHDLELQDWIIKQEKALLTFDVRSSTAKLKSLLSADFKEIGASGDYFYLDSVLESLPKEDNWSASVQEFEFRMLSDDIAQLNYYAYIKHNLDDGGTYSLRTSFWRKEGDDWRMVFHQGTVVPPFEK